MPVLEFNRARNREEYTLSTYVWRFLVLGMPERL